MPAIQAPLNEDGCLGILIRIFLLCSKDINVCQFHVTKALGEDGGNNVEQYEHHGLAKSIAIEMP
jgi:hypothetical protein